MLFSSRRSDDADVIRARLRALLAEGSGRQGWLPDDGPHEPDRQPRREPWEDEEDEDSWTLDPDDTDTDDTDTGTDDTDVDGPPGPGPTAERSAGRHRASGPSTRVDPGPHGTRTLWVVAVLAALLVAGWSWATRPEVSPAPTAGGAVGAAAIASTAASSGAPAVPAAITGRPTGPGPQQIVVSVVGQVVSPGLVTLPAGARVADALAAAGGMLPEADPAAVNAAAVLADGQQVAVGVLGAGGATAAAAGSGGGGLLDLNAAGVADLDALPGIGPVLAQRILDHRTAHGPFTSVEQLDDVSGIGPALFADLAPLVTV